MMVSRDRVREVIAVTLVANVLFLSFLTTSNKKNVIEKNIALVVFYEMIET